jgi:hypothetical protein
MSSSSPIRADDRPRTALGIERLVRASHAFARPA